MFWIILILVVMLVIVFFVGYFNLDQPANTERLTIWEFTFEDVKTRTTYIVTAVDISDAREILLEEYEMSPTYYRNFVWLVKTEQVF